jgi:hypothetical protein
MTRLIEDYLREVDASLRVDATRKRHILDELRSHLTEKTEELHSGSPERPVEDIEREVLREFGSARELALAYEPSGVVVLTNEAGDIVLRLGKAVGRGAKAVGRSTGTILKWTAVALAVLLVTSLGVGAWAYYEVKPYIPSIIEQSEPSYQYYEKCADTPCSGAPPADVFYVSTDARSVRFDVNVYSVHKTGDRDRHYGNGTLQVSVVDPTGVKLFDRTFNNSEGASAHQEMRWAAVEGNWTVAVAYDGFIGAVDVEAYAITFPWGDEDR